MINPESFMAGKLSSTLSYSLFNLPVLEVTLLSICSRAGCCEQLLVCSVDGELPGSRRRQTQQESAKQLLKDEHFVSRSCF